jgi:hypothetical protein
MMPEQSMPQYITLTNQADNSDNSRNYGGRQVSPDPVDKLTTPSGTFAMQTSTNAAPIYLPDGSVAQNYTGDPSMGAPAPTIGGGGMAVTNAPTAAPSPAPQQLREGSVVRQNGVTYRITNGVPVPVTGP